MTGGGIVSRRLPGRTLQWIAGGLLALVLAAAAVSAAGSLGLRWDPFGLQARRLVRAEAEAARLRQDAARIAAVLEAERVLSRESAAAGARVATAAADTRSLEAAARGASDASLPLSPDRLARLRAHDRRLCELAPALEGCAAASGDPGGRAAAMPSGNAAAGRHPG